MAAHSLPFWASALQDASLSPGAAGLGLCLAPGAWQSHGGAGVKPRKIQLCACCSGSAGHADLEALGVSQVTTAWAP